MEERISTGKNLTFEELSELRGKTEAVSQLLQTQLKGYLETLRTLLAPRRLFGEFGRSGIRDSALGAEKTFAELQEKYKEVCGKPFGLPAELDRDSLAAIETRLELYPWEYTHEATSERETKTVVITSPVRWALTYSSGYTFSELRQAMAGKGDRRTDYIRQFVVNALVLHFVLSKYPGITEILTDLRYEVQMEKSPGLGDLPLVTINACLRSFRPSDELILAATRLSGVPAFIELIDIDSVLDLKDPLKFRIGSILR